MYRIDYFGQNSMLTDYGPSFISQDTCVGWFRVILMFIIANSSFPLPSFPLFAEVMNDIGRNANAELPWNS